MATYVTWQDTTSDGVQTQFNIIFPFLDRAHVEVYFGSTLQATSSWSFDSDSQLTLNTAAGSGTVVRVKRNTPQTVLTDFVGAIVDEADLDNGYLQQLYIAQELQDRWDEAVNGNVTVSLTGVVQNGEFVNNSVRYKDNTGSMGNVVLAAGEVVGFPTGGTTVTNMNGTQIINNTDAGGEVISLILALA